MKVSRDSGLLLVLTFSLLAFAGIIAVSWSIYRYAAQGMNRNLDQLMLSACSQAVAAAQEAAHEPRQLQQHLEYIRLSARLEKLFVFDLERKSLGDANLRVAPGKRYTYLELPPNVSDTVFASRTWSLARTEVETFSDDVVFRGVALPVRVGHEVVGGAYAVAGIEFDDDLAALRRNWMVATGLASGVSLVLIGVFVVLFRRNQTIRQMMERQSRMAMIHQLSAGIAHDIKNPLTVIMNASELQAERASTDRKLMTLIMEGSERVLSITEQLLGTGRMNEVAEIELAGFVEDACRPFLTVARGRGVQIKYELESGAVVRASPTPLRMAVSNIVHNAVQALDEGGRVHLSLRRDDERIGVAVSDNGPGISPSRQRKIFEPLETSKRQGTGLGLPVARQLMEDMHGSIELESELGVGTTFTLWLPLLKDHGEDTGS